MFALHDWLDRSAERSIKQLATEQSCLDIFFFTFKLLHADFSQTGMPSTSAVRLLCFRKVSLHASFHARVTERDVSAHPKSSNAKQHLRMSGQLGSALLRETRMSV